MLKTTIIGASGYTGAELVLMVFKHPHLSLSGLYVSENSLDKGKAISELHGSLKGVVDDTLQPLVNVNQVAKESDIVLLATAHEVSHDLAATFLENGCVVFDLSGALDRKSVV